MLNEGRKLSRYNEFKLRAHERVRVQQPLQICPECRSKGKKHDNLSRKAGNNLPILSVLAEAFITF